MAKLKVAQCWDDGVMNDLRLTEMLRKYGAKATFNLNPGGMHEERISPSWRKFGTPGWDHKGFCGGRLSLKDIPVVYDGFQVASHCWGHENADSLPPEEWIKCAVSAREFLEDIVQRPCRGFAWPCGVYTSETCAELRKAGFAYGRTTKYAADLTGCEDAMALKSSCHYQDWGFWEKYQAAKKQGGIFYFWGHSYEMFEYDKLWEQLEMKIRYISEDPEAEWVDVVDIAPLCDGKLKK